MDYNHVTLDSQPQLTKFIIFIYNGHPTSIVNKLLFNAFVFVHLKFNSFKYRLTIKLPKKSSWGDVEPPSWTRPFSRDELIGVFTTDIYSIDGTGTRQYLFYTSNFCVSCTTRLVTNVVINRHKKLNFSRSFVIIIILWPTVKVCGFVFTTRAAAATRVTDLYFLHRPNSRHVIRNYGTHTFKKTGNGG